MATATKKRPRRVAATAILKWATKLLEAHFGKSDATFVTVNHSAFRHMTSLHDYSGGYQLTVIINGKHINTSARSWRKLLREFRDKSLPVVAAELGKHLVPEYDPIALGA